MLGENTAFCYNSGVMELKKYARAKVTYISNSGIMQTIEVTDLNEGAVEVKFRVKDAVYTVHKENIKNIEKIGTQR